MCVSTFIQEVCDGDLQAKMRNSSDSYPTHAMREWVTVEDVKHLREVDK